MDPDFKSDLKNIPALIFGLLCVVFIAVGTIESCTAQPEETEQATQTKTTQQVDWKESMGRRYAKCDTCGRYAIPMTSKEVTVHKNGPGRHYLKKSYWEKTDTCEYCTEGKELGSQCIKFTPITIAPDASADDETIEEETIEYTDDELFPIDTDDDKLTE